MQKLYPKTEKQSSKQTKGDCKNFGGELLRVKYGLGDMPNVVLSREQRGRRIISG